MPNYKVSGVANSPCRVHVMDRKEWKGYKDVEVGEYSIVFPLTSPEVFTEDFIGVDGSLPNTNLWGHSTTAGGTVTISNNQAYFYQEAYGLGLYNKLISKFKISGDFEIEHLLAYFAGGWCSFTLRMIDQVNGNEVKIVYGGGDADNQYFYFYNTVEGWISVNYPVTFLTPWNTKRIGSTWTIDIGGNEHVVVLPNDINSIKVELEGRSPDGSNGLFALYCRSEYFKIKQGIIIDGIGIPDPDEFNIVICAILGTGETRSYGKVLPVLTSDNINILTE